MDNSYVYGSRQNELVTIDKVVKAVRLSTPEDIRNSIESILNQLEKNKIAITHDVKTVRLFWRFIPENYKRDERIILTRKCGANSKNIIIIKPPFQLVRKDIYSFKISIDSKKL